MRYWYQSLFIDFDSRCVKSYEVSEQFLIKVSTYLQLNLPLDEQILFDVKVLHPLQKNMYKATNVIKRLAAVVIHALGKKAK